MEGVLNKAEGRLSLPSPKVGYVGGWVCSLYDHPDREKEAGERHIEAIASHVPVFLESNKTRSGFIVRLKVFLIGVTTDTQEQSGTKD